LNEENNEASSEDRKDKSRRPEERFSELGQQAGAVLGQLFAAAEQFGQQVSRESEAWSESGSSREPFVSAMRQASEEFRATANRAAENFSEAFDQATTSADDEKPESGDVADASEIKPGNVHRIGGGADRTTTGEVTRVESVAITEPAPGSTTGTTGDRAEQLAEIFRADPGLSELTTVEFEALKKLVEKQYRSVREYQGRVR
jgi:hypothetical protein